MKLTKFSIIMPCYNSQEYIDNAIQSVVNQEWHNWELIVVNDGSSDRTLEIIQRYSEIDSRIKVYSKSNGGYVSAVNCGLKLITGDYFLLMGSDDRLNHSLLKSIAEAIQTIDPDIIAFRTKKFIGYEDVGYDTYTTFQTTLYIQESNALDCEQRIGEYSNIFFVRDTSKCYKRSILYDLRYFGKFGYDADGIFSTLFSQKCTSFLCLPVDGYIWTLRDDSLSSKTNKSIDLDRLHNWNQYVDYISNLNFNEISNHAKAYILYAVGVCKKLLVKRDLSFSEIRTLTKIETKLLAFLRKDDLLYKEVCQLHKWRRILLLYNIMYHIIYYKNGNK